MYAGGVPAAFGVTKSPGGGGVRRRRTSLTRAYGSFGIRGRVPNFEVLTEARKLCFLASNLLEFGTLLRKCSVLSFNKCKKSADSLVHYNLAH